MFSGLFAEDILIRTKEQDFLVLISNYTSQILKFSYDGEPLGIWDFDQIS